MFLGLVDAALRGAHDDYDVPLVYPQELSGPSDDESGNSPKQQQSVEQV